jgi:catechol 2,3-dioxygenase-like lactoylglutathione lyase family enzyme
VSGLRGSDGIVGQILGVHHVRVPVSDPWTSADWYVATLGFEAVLDLEESDGVVGVLLRHPGGTVLGLHRDPERAAAMAGFAVLGLTVADEAAIDLCAGLLDRLDVPRSPVKQGHLGWYFDIADPDGIVIRVHTSLVIDSDDT